MEGARWCRESGAIEESLPGELFTSMPVIWLQPVATASLLAGGGGAAAKKTTGGEAAAAATAPSYACPVYKTTARSGVLSTTGLSTNFVVSLDLPAGAAVEPSHWILRGVAMICMLDE
jgi:dynein heavy chain